MHDLVRELYPLCRSITGNGVRRTLEIVGRETPLEVHEVPSGTQVLDWVVPREWNVREAWIRGPKSETVVDFRRSNLHVVGYSQPVHARMSLAELRPHLYSLPEHPDWIPYRNSFYRDAWGFCLSHRQLESLVEGEYEVRIDSTLGDGSLTYAEAVVPGASRREVLLSCHVCHPSLCNDNLSGISLLTLLARYLSQLSLRYTYRILFVPVTIGAITWLARNEHRLASIDHGLVVTLVGDSGRSTYKRSRRGDAPIDRVLAHVLRHRGEHQVVDFSPYGYDERQFCSPGFDLPVGCLMRTPHGQYPEYHTSADDLDFVKPAALEDSLAKVVAVIEVLENDARYRNLSPKGEPQLGRRGIYRALADRGSDGGREMALLWVLNLSDGAHSLLDIAERAGTPFHVIADAASVLAEHGLLKRVEAGDTP
jgi:aminopeptidase-like protein